MAFRYEIRAVTRADQGDLLELARYLDSVNLPNDPAEMEPIIAKSEASFAGTIEDPCKREYVFVLYDREEKRAAGTSLIVAQLGRRDAPYIYLRVRKEERYSRTLDKHFVHHVLRAGYSYDGPTEIGGLVMHPDYRRMPGKLGTQISYIRFLFIATNRHLFREQILAELLPPLEKDGTSHLWEALGRHFTDMDYRTADRLSRRNKEFIRGLFPDGDIYASLLPKEARDLIGQVGPQTRGVEKLLRRIGFRYVDRVDPFDGGPHFMAAADEVSLVQETVRRRVVFGSPAEGQTGLVAHQTEAPPYFRAALICAEITPNQVVLGDEDAAALLLKEGDEVSVLPL